MLSDGLKDKLFNGCVVWITGMSGAGKTTIANKITSKLRENGKYVILLDGDELRKVLGKELNHSPKDRMKLAKKYSELCCLIAKQGFIVVIATISLFREIHKWNRKNIPNYIEVYLKVPIEELKRRDVKGIYNRFETGDIKNVYGLDIPIDEPEFPDWVENFNPSRPASMIANELNTFIIKRINK